MIQRTNYLNKIKPFIDQNIIKVLVGVRRSGKTVLLQQIKDLLLEKDIEEKQIIYINFESLSSSFLTHDNSLYDFIISKWKEINKKLYLLFDEIQEVDGFERILSSFLVDIPCDIYITGSSSKLMSNELATFISGRYVHFDILPFTFKEFRNENNDFRSDEELFLEYLSYGGFPFLSSLKDELSKDIYLEDIFNTIVLKDILDRFKVNNPLLLKKILIFLFDNVGNIFSGRSIQKSLAQANINTTVPTILSYIDFITSSCCLIKVSRYDTKGKQLLTNNEKYYSVDLGLRNHLKTSEIVDYGKLFENIVLLELLERGFKVLVGKVDKEEIDFIAIKKEKKFYIQVSYLLSSQETINREMKPLLKINDNYPKYIISFDKLDFSSEGIKHLNIISFLLKDEIN